MLFLQIGSINLNYIATSNSSINCRKILNISRFGILNSQYFDTKRKRIKPEVKKSQICLVIFEIMNKLCEYYECDLIARVTINNSGMFEDKSIDFFSKMPTVKRRFDEYDNNDDSNLNLNNKIIFFPIEADNDKPSEERKDNEEDVEQKNQSIVNKVKDKDIIEHNYNKVTPKFQEFNHSHIEENASFSDKKKSPISEKSTSKSSGKSSNNNYINEVLINMSSFKYISIYKGNWILHQEDYLIRLFIVL
jgi:hypothetical protein